MKRRATCHLDRPHHAKGLCKACWSKSRRGKNRAMAVCHPTRPHHAKDLCRQCYKARWDRADHIDGPGPRQCGDNVYPGCELTGEKLDFLKAVDRLRHHLRRPPGLIDVYRMALRLGYRRKGDTDSDDGPTASAQGRPGG